MESDRDPWSRRQQPADYRFAEVAESLASSFDRLAATYRRMASGAHSRDKTARLLGHATRLEDQARHERDEAVRLRQIVNAHG